MTFFLSLLIRLHILNHKHAELWGILHVDRSLFPAALDSWVFSFTILISDTISNSYLFECLLHKWQYGKKNQRKLELAWTLMSCTSVVSRFVLLVQKTNKIFPRCLICEADSLESLCMEGVHTWVQVWKSVCECGCACASPSSARTEHLLAWSGYTELRIIGWKFWFLDHPLILLRKNPSSRKPLWVVQGHTARKRWNRHLN